MTIGDYFFAAFTLIILSEIVQEVFWFGRWLAQMINTWAIEKERDSWN